MNLGGLFWRFQCVRGPKPYACIPRDSSLDTIIKSNYDNIITGIHSVFEQFCVRKFFLTFDEEKRYIAKPSNSEPIRPYKAVMPSEPKRQRIELNLESSAGEF